MIFRLSAGLALVVTLTVAWPSTARAADSPATPWPVVPSDLAPDPALRSGTLPNGVRYLILPNAEPKDRISVRLLVAVGSLHENDDERGLAHFVEHMAFRGTRVYPAGSLTAALQRLGVSHGPDSTAFTLHDYTIYHLELPDTREITLDAGLRAFREYADGVTFDEALIERERGVILSEMDTRNTPEARAADANLHFNWSRSREARRQPIGLAGQIRAFRREQFVAFYDAWYRPERLGLVVVGDLDPSLAERRITALFGDLAARAPARSEPTDRHTLEADPPSVDVFADPGLVGFTLNIQHPWREPRTEDTHALRVRELHRSLAFAMLHARLQRLARQPDASFLAPTAGLSTAIRDWRLATLGANGRIDAWQKTATDIEQEHRRAFQFGFTARELAEVRAAFATAYEQGVRTAPTRPSAWLAQQLAGHLLRGGTWATPAAMQRDLADDLASASVSDCLAAFRAVWTSRSPNVFIAAHPSFRITREQIAAVLNASRQTAVTRPIETAVAEFAYTDFGPPGRLVREEHLADLDVRLSQFANGVRLNFKATNFEADAVDVRVRVGEGKLQQSLKQPGLDYLAHAALTAGGVGRHTATELGEILAGRALQVGFHIESDACVFIARCAPRELTLCLQLIAAYLTDASYRPDVMRAAQASFNSVFASLAASPSGPITLRAPRILAGGDARFGVPELAELYARTLPELKAWLDPQFQRGAIELSVVGDVAWAEVTTAVARTLGALPKRRARREFSAAAKVHPPAAPLNATVYTIDPRLKLSGLAWYWPVPAVADIHEERRWHLLAQVFVERLRQSLREELGAAYVSSASFSDTDGFPRLNFLSVYTEVDPARADRAAQLIRREAMSLALSGPRADEFTRARQPYLRSMSDNLRTNIYWSATVLSDAQQQPKRLAAARDRADDIARITADDLARLARAHLDPANAYRFTTVPAATAFPPPGPAAGSSAAAGTAGRRP